MPDLRFSMIVRTLCSIAAAGALTACSHTPQHYEWGNFEGQLYGYLKQGDPAWSRQIAVLRYGGDMQRFDDDLNASTRELKDPPGFHAHLGRLYERTGDRASMVREYARETELYPESAVFMQRLQLAQDPQVGSGEVPGTVTPLPATTPVPLAPLPMPEGMPGARPERAVPQTDIPVPARPRYPLQKASI